PFSPSCCLLRNARLRAYLTSTIRYSPTPRISSRECHHGRRNSHCLSRVQQTAANPFTLAGQENSLQGLRPHVYREEAWQRRRRRRGQEQDQGGGIEEPAPGFRSG